VRRRQTGLARDAGESKPLDKLGEETPLVPRRRYLGEQSARYTSRRATGLDRLAGYALPRGSANEDAAARGGTVRGQAAKESRASSTARDVQDGYLAGRLQNRRGQALLARCLVARPWQRRRCRRAELDLEAVRPETGNTEEGRLRAPRRGRANAIDGLASTSSWETRGRRRSSRRSRTRCAPRTRSWRTRPRDRERANGTKSEFLATMSTAAHAAKLSLILAKLLARQQGREPHGGPGWITHR